MTQTIKFSESEMAEIKVLQTKFQEMIVKFGEHYFEKIELDRLVAQFVEKEKSLKDALTALQNQEKELLDKIVKKYGEGHLSLTDGTFTPSPK